MENRLAAAVGWLRPTDEPVQPGRFPYRFDAKSYLDSAREMDWFWEARLREPLFVLWTQFALAVAGGQDRGVSLGSTIASFLILVPVFAIGSILAGPAAGLLAAAVVAAEPDLIRHGTEGLRAELFTLLLLLFAWAALAYWREPISPGGEPCWASPVPPPA